MQSHAQQAETGGEGSDYWDGNGDSISCTGTFFTQQGTGSRPEWDICDRAIATDNVQVQTSVLTFKGYRKIDFGTIVNAESCGVLT